MTDLIYNILKNDATVSGLLTESGKFKYFPLRTPQAQQLPFAIYRIQNTQPTDSKQGVSILDELTLDIAIYSGIYEVGVLIANAIRSALDRYSLNTIDKIIFESETDNYDNSAKVYFKEQQYKIRLKR